MIFQVFNYSSKTVSLNYSFGKGVELVDNIEITKNSVIELDPWCFKIIEEK